jgi:hypothetical protein
MANEMTSFVRVKKANDNVVKRLKEIFTPSEGKYDVSSIELLNRVYGTNYSYEADKEDWDREKDWPSNEEWESKMGPKWSYGEEFYMDEGETEGSFIIRSAWSVPQNLLFNIAKELYTIKEDCYLVGNYEDEGYDPVGAFIYANDYDDIEDLDHAYDPQDLWEDDTLRDQLWEENSELERDIEKAYFEYLEDRKNNPQDYE